jgi:putative Holliday junction resolvase
MVNKRVFLGLDVGTKRIGLAIGDSIARIAQPLATLPVDGTITDQLQAYLQQHDVTDVVVGRPRNQSGETTDQTIIVERFVRTKMPMHYAVRWQDESVTSVLAEDRLKARKKPYTKGDIDAEAAAIILQDFLETL